MAEFVEFRAEEWVHELEQMERIHLFESKEIKTLATNRKQLEYKIQKRTKCKSDFLKFIQFEIDLHRVIKARRKKTGIRIKKAEIEDSQIRRTVRLFKLAVLKFPQDIQLWMSFFKFCKGVKLHSTASQMMVQMLQFHSNKPDLWKFAANWEYQECKSISNARQFLMKGLRHHPTSQTLYQELLKLEINHIKEKNIEVMKNQKKYSNWVPDEVTQNILEGKVAEVVYRSAVKTIPGVDFKVSLLKTAELNAGPRNVIDKIFEDIVRCHLGEELAWDAIAKRELKGFPCDVKEFLERDKENEVVREMEVEKETEAEEEMEVEKEKENDMEEQKEQQTKKNKVSLRDRIQRSVGIYEEAVRKLNTPKMWGLYLLHVFKLKKQRNLPNFKVKLVQNAIQGALNSGNLSERDYLLCIDFLRKDGKRNKLLSEVLRKGTETYRGNLPMWHARVKFFLSRDKEEKGMKVFNEAISHLTETAPIWKLVIKYLLLKSSPRAEEVLKEGLKEGKQMGELARILKPFYLEWTARTKGMPEARAVFESPEVSLPPCLELYQKMAALESSQVPPVTERVRKCHELVVTNFGANDPSVWMDYVKFELNEGDKTKVAQIHRRALKSLSPEQADEFVSEFNDFKLESTKI